MSKRLTMMTAGPYTEVTVCPVLSGQERPHERAVIRKCCSQAMQCINDRKAARRFKLLLAANFGPHDYVVTLTYSDAALPATPELARKKKLKPFINHLRDEFKKRGYPTLKYMYVTEGLHGDHRIHHHLILPNVPDLFQIVRRLWQKNGTVAFDRIGADAYDGWASYLTKEPRDKGRRRLGDRMWIPSMKLEKPTIETFEVENDFVFVPPHGADIRNDNTIRYETGWYQYVSYMMPQSKPEKSEN